MDGRPFRTEHIAAEEAPLRFARMIRAIKDGGTRFVVTENGTPVARIVPIVEDDGVTGGEDRRRRHSALMAWLEAQPRRVVGPWTRDELYDDDAKDGP